MDRRVVLMGLAAGVVSGPALAQSSSPSSTAMPGSGTKAMSQAETEHAMNTAMVGMASLQMADIALQKAQNPKVKEFAQFEHDEQTTIAEVLKSMDPGMAPPKPDAKTAEMIAKLNSLKAGAEFDRDFIQGQIDGHQKLLAIQEDYLKTGRDRDTINATKLMRGMIKEHLTLLGDLHKTVG